MSFRPDQVASSIRRAVQSELGRGLHDPRVRGLISVTKVSVDRDLSNATVLVSVLPAKHASLTLQGLQHAAARIRARVGKAVRMRHVPSLSFQLDETIKKQAEFDAALAEGRPAGPPEEQEGSGSIFPEGPVEQE